MKKTLSVVLCLMMVFMLTACGGANNSDNDKNNSSKTPDNSSQQSSVDANSMGTSSDVDSSQTVPVNGSVDGFFDDAVFIGDSVTLKLNLFVDKVRDNIGLECLDNAKFLCSGSLGFANAAWDIDAENNVHPTYQGTKYLVPDGVKAIGAKKVFIMLGMNDFSLYGIDQTVENAKNLINSILEKSQIETLYIQSVTPMIEKAQYGDFTNENIEKLNVELKKLWDENNYKYLDVASALKDENGCLPEKYCSDPDAQGIHFTDEACEIWIDYLENNA